MKSLIIIPYFGRLPNYFELWLQSVRFNSNFEWLLLTDDKTTYEYPQNIQVVYTDFDTVKNKIKSKFEFEISLDSPYKLCDFKVAYGYIFQEYLKGYDFWGYGDVDVIYGNLNNFISKDVFDTYDKILPNGHLSFFRNNDLINKLFMSGEMTTNYKTIFSSPKAFCFDEWPGITGFIKETSIIPQLDSNLMVDIDWTTFKLKHSKKDIANYQKQGFVFENGSIYQLYGDNARRKEFAYIHFQKRYMHFDKSNYNPQINYNMIFQNDQFILYTSVVLDDFEKIKISQKFNILSFYYFYSKLFNRRLNNFFKKFIVIMNLIN